MNVLLSIKPKYADAIFSGTKKYEFRRTIFKRKDIEKVYVYSNSTVKKIVGSFEIEDIIKGTPSQIWDKCNKYGGILKEGFFEYFHGSDTAFGIKIKDATAFDPPLDPNSVVENFTPPQSFYYLSSDLFQES